MYDSEIEIMHLPQTMHSARDFDAMKRELERTGRLSTRLYSMYAKELYISGNTEDFLAAAVWFEQRLGQEKLSQEAQMEAICVLAKKCALQEEWEQLLSYCLMGISINLVPAAELCFLLGLYFERVNNVEESIFWYKRAALEAECYVCISYGGSAALQQAIRLLRKQGRQEEALQYEDMMRREA